MEHITAAGLDIHCGMMTLRRDQRWESPIERGYWIGTVLQGEVAAEQPWTSQRAWRPGVSMLFKSDRPTSAIHHAPRDGQLSALFLRLHFDAAEGLVGPEGLSVLERGTRSGVRPCPALISALGWQIQGCALPGSAARLYIVGKALEVIAHVIADIENAVGAPSGPGSSLALSAREARQLHEARDILLGNLRAPPTIPELARQVGTNAHKLGEGFRALFGTPIYAFVKSRRLEEAKRQLEGGETSITAVARSVGYHPGHFATEFRRRFGVTPTALIGRRPAELGGCE